MRFDRLGGYTLIELVVVMALISTMFFFAMPRFQDNLLTDQVRKASRWIITQTRHLKQQSVREKKDYILHVDTEAVNFGFQLRIWIEKRFKRPSRRLTTCQKSCPSWMSSSQAGQNIRGPGRYLFLCQRVFRQSLDTHAA